MPISVGDDAIRRIALGSTEIKRVSLGSTLLWQAITTTDFALDSANQYATGIAWDGEHFNVIDFHDRKIYKYDEQGTYQSAQDFALASGNTRSVGIAWDGSSYYVANENPGSDERIYKYTSAGAAAGNFAVDEAATARGMTWDGTYLCILGQDIVDSRVRHEINRYEANGDHHDTITLSSVPSGAGNLGGLIWDGSRFRVVETNTDRVLAFSSSGAYQSAHSFALNTMNNIPSGLEWVNDHIYCVNGSSSAPSLPRKVFVYSSNGTYVGGS